MKNVITFGLGLVICLGTLSLLSVEAEAQQAPAGVPPDCQFQVNPHSYSCTRWTFDGNQMFPLNLIDWNGVLQGRWQPLTFSDVRGGNENNEFSMMKNPARPTIPEGVLDRATNRLLAPLQIRGGQVIFENWHGFQLQSLPGTLLVPDRFTARFQFADGQGVGHTFNCRDFNRNQNHHLLCAWDTWNPRSQTWVHRGFIGFLRTR